MSSYTDITPWTWAKSYAGTYRMTTDTGSHTVYVTDSFSGKQKWGVRVQDRNGDTIYSMGSSRHSFHGDRNFGQRITPLGFPTMKQAKAKGYSVLMNIANGQTEGINFK